MSHISTTVSNAQIVDVKCLICAQILCMQFACPNAFPDETDFQYFLPAHKASQQNKLKLKVKIFPSRGHQATIHEATCTAIDPVSPRVQDLRIQSSNHGWAVSK